MGFLRISEDVPGAKGPQKGPAETRRARGIEIDSKLKVDWDEEGLASHLAQFSGLVSKGPSKDLSGEIAALQTAGKILAEAQSRELRFQLSRFAAGGLEVKGRPELQQAKQELVEFRTAAIQELTGRKGPGSQYVKDITATLSGADDDGFVPLKEAANDIANEAAKEIEKKLDKAPTVKMYLSAFLVTPVGKPYQVHLEGYDKVVAGAPKPFARNRLVLDERTRQELQAAQQVLAALQQYRNLDLARSATQCRSAAASALAQLQEKFNLKTLDEECDKIIVALREVQNAHVPALLKSIRSLQALVRPVSRHPILSAGSQIEGISLLAELLTTLGRDLWTFVEKAPTLLPNLFSDLEKFFAEQPNVIREDAVAFWKRAREDFGANFEAFRNEAKAVTQTVNDTSRALMLTEDFSLIGKDLLGKSLGDGEALDTELDLKTIPQVRRPGDRVVLKVALKRMATDQVGEKEPPKRGLASVPDAPEEEPKLDEVTIEEGSEELYVEVVGGYWQTSGSLLFVNPRSRIERSINYEPTPGLGLNYHVGIRGRDYWNRILNPGVGFSLKMLDFDDNQSFEVGAALGVTLFNDALWMGYGKNLNLGKDYFYIGINPYVLTRFLRPR